jgi:RNA polymerase primary sigma factor
MSDSLRDYLNQIGKIPLLTGAEEIELGHAIKKMMDIDLSASLSKTDERILRIGKRAKNRMIKGNLRLVVGVAKKFKHFTNRLTMADLIQEGNLGLMRAVELFDPERGYKFSTYAYWWIRQGIMRSIQTQDRIIKLPTGAIEILRKIRSFSLEYYRQHGRTPTIDECAEFANITPRAMKHYLAASIDAGSLDAKVNNSGEASTYIELIACNDQLVDDYIEQGTKIEAVHQALNHMSELNKQIIVLRHGLNDNQPRSVRDIAKTLNIAQDTTKRKVNIAENEMKLILRNGPPKKHSLQNNSSSLIWGWG